MFKALFLALAAAASWTVSGQEVAPPEPTSPLPMLSMQGPEAPQAPEAAPAPTVARLRQVAEPRMIKRHTPAKAKAPKQVKVRHIEKPKAPKQVKIHAPQQVVVHAPKQVRFLKNEVKAQDQASNARQVLLNQLQLLQAENARLKDALEHKQGALHEVQVQQYEQRAHAHKNQRLHAEHQVEARVKQAEARALNEEARAIKLELRALKGRRPQEQAARALEHREMALKAREIAAIARAQAGENARFSRGKVLEHRRLAEEAALIEIEAQAIHRKHLVELSEAHKGNMDVIVDGTHEVHLQELLGTYEKDAEGLESEIEFLVESLEGMGELFEVRMEGLEGAHEIHMDGIEGLVEVIELLGASEGGELIELQGLGELIELKLEDLDGIHELHLEGIEGLVESLELHEFSEGEELFELKELGELFESSELVELQELGSLKVLLKGLEGQMVELKGLDKLHELGELHELGNLGGLRLLLEEQNDGCEDQDCCDEGDDDCCEGDDEDCCDDEQDCEVSQRGFFSISDNKPRRIVFDATDGQAQHMYFGTDGSEHAVIDIRGEDAGDSIQRVIIDPNCESGAVRFETKDGKTRQLFGTTNSKGNCETFVIRDDSNSPFAGHAKMIKVQPGAKSLGWSATTTTGTAPQAWVTSTSKKGPSAVWTSVAPSGKGWSESTVSTTTSRGTSVIQIDNNGGQIFIGTRDGKTQIDCGSGSSCAPTPAVQGRVFFTTDSPPAPTCETPVKSNSGVSMNPFPSGSFPVPSAVPAPAVPTYPEAVRDYTFASQTRTDDATLAELERMLTEVLREVDALQVEVNRVRTAVNRK